MNPKPARPHEIRSTDDTGLNLNLILILVLCFFLYLSLSACSKTDTAVPNEAIYQKTDYGTLIPYQIADPDLKSRFNKNVLADSLYYEKGDTAWTGFKTQNRRFFEDVITPAIEPYLDTLSTLSPSEIINQLALFTFNIYQAYFGQSFYRWGGDLFDLDDPQTHRGSSRKLYGLDCSGFVAAPYEMAVHFNLLPDTVALFSWQGFKYYCEKTGFEDQGGLDGGSNNYRLDTRELYRLGDEILRIEKGGSLSPDDLTKLRPGDIAGRNGHVGIIVFINNEPYYLESGGRVVPPTGGYPVKADSALEIFARNRYVSVRRGIWRSDEG
ncbi:hypothetical protein [Fidelibacter multiformis]|uniref:hypothetical protein n=1 Tax=Fidelibacter multiformis TaxID=3377529 RepID=UPI0037DC71D8